VVALFYLPPRIRKSWAIRIIKKQGVKDKFIVIKKTGIMKNRLKRLLVPTITSLFTVCLLHAQTPPIAGNWELIPELSDEFDGGIDAAKWHTNDPKWDGRFPSYFESTNVSVKDGLLQLTCREINDHDNPPTSSKGDYTHATAAFKSKTRVKYGYFEVEAKATNSRYWNSFWLYDYTDLDWTEIDVYEIVAGENYLVRTSHLFYARPDYEGTEEDHIKEQQEVAPWLAGWEYEDGFFANYHVYGLDWNKDSITWYVDGVSKFTVVNEHWHQELYLILDAEVNPAWPALPESSEEIYQIKYIRSWKKRPSFITSNSSNPGKSSIYPNPGTGMFNLNISSTFKGQVSIRVFDVNGRQISALKLQKNETEFEHQIDLSNQTSGVYIVQFVAGEYRCFKKVVLF